MSEGYKILFGGVRVFNDLMIYAFRCLNILLGPRSQDYWHGRRARHWRYRPSLSFSELYRTQTSELR